MSRSIDSLRAFMAGRPGANAFEPRPGVVVVGSGKGGVGTSTVAALLALGAARRGESVLLVDADESVGALHLLFGLKDPGPGLGSLRGGHATPADLLHVVAPGVTLLPGGGGGVDATLASATAERRALLRRVAGLYERFGVVVVDGGSRLESVLAACAVGTERLLCVTSPGRISLAASYALFKVARTRFPGMPVELVINGTDDRRGLGLHAVVRQATQSFLGSDVSLGGTLPSDDSLVQALEAGTSLAAVFPHLEAGVAAGAIADRILLEQDRSLDAGTPVVAFPTRR